MAALFFSSFATSQVIIEQIVNTFVMPQFIFLLACLIWASVWFQLHLCFFKMIVHLCLCSHFIVHFLHKFFFPEKNLLFFFVYFPHWKKISLYIRMLMWGEGKKKKVELKMKSQVISLFFPQQHFDPWFSSLSSFEYLFFYLNGWASSSLIWNFPTSLTAIMSFHT